MVSRPAPCWPATLEEPVAVSVCTASALLPIWFGAQPFRLDRTVLRLVIAVDRRLSVVVSIPCEGRGKDEAGSRATTSASHGRYTWTVASIPPRERDCVTVSCHRGGNGWPRCACNSAPAGTCPSGKSRTRAAPARSSRLPSSLAGIERQRLRQTLTSDNLSPRRRSGDVSNQGRCRAGDALRRRGFSFP